MAHLMGVFGGPRTVTGRDVAPRDERMFGIGSALDLIPPRPYLKPQMPVVTTDTAMRHSAVWAALRLRADMVSTMPLIVYRIVNGIQVKWPTPPVLIDPEGNQMANGGTGIVQWMYASQIDLDRLGNCFGLITARDGNGLPARIELQQGTACSVIQKNGKLHKYRINGTIYDPADVWHERQYTVAGLPVGLSPIAYASWAIGEYLTVQQFAIDWFASGAVPRSRLTNKAKQLDPVEAVKVKEAWRASLAAGEPFVSGADWEYEMIQAAEASKDWLEAKKASVTDVARFLAVPADLVDATPTGSSNNVRYANITQAHLQFLVIHLSPAVVRRESALSALMPQPRYVKLDTDSLLRMDPKSLADLIQTKVTSRVLAPSEARELDDRPPFTESQLEEFDRLFGPPKTGEGAGGVPQVEPSSTPELPPGQEQAALPPGQEQAALPAGQGG